MSIPVALPDLAQTAARYRFAYLLASGGDGAPRAIAIAPQVAADGALTIAHVGQRTRANIAAHAAVGLVWPPLEAGAYSLIVDGSAQVVGEGVRITPTHAVLHRPAPGLAPGA